MILYPQLDGGVPNDTRQRSEEIGYFFSSSKIGRVPKGTPPYPKIDCLGAYESLPIGVECWIISNIRLLTYLLGHTFQ